jgi:hypothetical protein
MAPLYPFESPGMLGVPIAFLAAWRAVKPWPRLREMADFEKPRLHALTGIKPGTAADDSLVGAAGRIGRGVLEASSGTDDPTRGLEQRLTVFGERQRVRRSVDEAGFQTPAP